MSRADRLFRILDQLRRHRFLTAAQLAERLEVSVRTIYRDVLDLNASGVPVLGEAGVGYHLGAGYDLPPLMFSTTELEALVIGMRMVESWGDSELRRSARSVLDKVNLVVSGSDRQRLDKTLLFSLSFGKGQLASRYLGELRHAVNQRHKLKLQYEDEHGAHSARSVRPLGLYFWGQSWTLAAYCELRQDFRNFRTDRIVELDVLEQVFELTPPCTLEDYVAAIRKRDLEREPESST